MTVPYVPGLAGVPAAESAISFVDGEKGVLEYRGIPITELAGKSTFEETTYLLLFGKLPTSSELNAFNGELVALRGIPDTVARVVRALPVEGHPMHALEAGVAALGMTPEASRGSTPEARRATALRLVAALPTLLALFQRQREGLPFVEPRSDLSHAANFLYLLRGEVPEPAETRVMDACLVLHADHTMNASTFTGRVIGSTLADGYSVVTGALGSLSGPLHGGANEAVLHMLHALGTREKVRAGAEGMIARKEKIMGVGHRVYKVKDPRAYVLQGLAEEMFTELGPSPLYELALELESVVEEKLSVRGIYPNVDFYSGIVYDRMKIPTDLFTPIFAVSRVSGWCAHWMEQMQDNRIFRPRQVYRGEHDRPYVPIGERS